MRRRALLRNVWRRVIALCFGGGQRRAVGRKLQEVHALTHPGAKVGPKRPVSVSVPDEDEEVPATAADVFALLAAESEAECEES